MTPSSAWRDLLASDSAVLKTGSYSHHHCDLTRTSTTLLYNILIGAPYTTSWAVLEGCNTARNNEAVCWSGSRALMPLKFKIVVSYRYKLISVHVVSIVPAAAAAGLIMTDSL